ncbi:MAG: NAD-dependent epimerase/dehydratase family protein [Eubacteriales bacterium]|jgi:nucleoside-diphosphate-sugar epimerase|nr:NAD-dependent epimerase/dehydratase family protein [Eubacteriales bacterium]
MLSGKKVLVLGGTGAMGVYLVPRLAQMGCQVDVISLDKVQSNDERITYTQADAKDDNYLKEVLKNRYDAIVDFLLYNTNEFSSWHEMMLKSTDHYMFFSTYRIYADSPVITEQSPRLLDVSADKDYLAKEEKEYSLYKARQEDILRSCGFGNWTIIRPAITYSKYRFQLVTLEANVVVYRAQKGLPVIVPQEALPVQATMSWAGDVANMLSRLVLNPAAYGETYTVATAEHHTWQEIADYYNEIIGLEYIPVDTETYLNLFGDWKVYAGYQLKYDRCFNRVIDNSKVLAATGLKQSELMPLKQGLKKELLALPKDVVWSETTVNAKMDELLKKLGK